MKWTPQVKKLVLKADCISIWFLEQPAGTASWDSKHPVRVHLTFEKKCPKIEGFDYQMNEDSWTRADGKTMTRQEWYVELESTGLLGRGYLDDVNTDTDRYEYYRRDRDNIYCPQQATWCFTSAKFNDTLQSILQVLPIDSKLVWRLIFDNNNQYAVRNKLHCDELHLFAMKERANGRYQELRFKLDSILCEHNTARPGYRSHKPLPEPKEEAA
jgi:hypothetical protein